MANGPRIKNGEPARGAGKSGGWEEAQKKGRRDMRRRYAFQGVEGSHRGPTRSFAIFGIPGGGLSACFYGVRRYRLQNRLKASPGQGPILECCVGRTGLQWPTLAPWLMSGRGGHGGDTWSWCLQEHDSNPALGFLGAWQKERAVADLDLQIVVCCIYYAVT